MRSKAISACHAMAYGIIDKSMKGRYLRADSNRLKWAREKVDQGIFEVHWESAKTNLAGYPTKHHSPTRHRAVRPIYTYQPDQSPTTMQGCANILGGIAAIRQPITKPAWLAKMKRKDGTISTTNAAPQAQSPTQPRRLKSITSFSSRRRHNAEEPFGSANLLQQLRPVPSYLAST